MPEVGQNITETISKHHQIKVIKLLRLTEIYNLLSV